MRKLVVAPTGYWQRGSGETVSIGDMIEPHLANAKRIVLAKLTEARLTRDRMSTLQARYGTANDPQARTALEEVRELIAALEAKFSELHAEHARRFGASAP